MSDTLTEPKHRDVADEAGLYRVKFIVEDVSEEFHKITIATNNPLASGESLDRLKLILWCASGLHVDQFRPNRVHIDSIKWIGNVIIDLSVIAGTATGTVPPEPA